MKKSVLAALALLMFAATAAQAAVATPAAPTGSNFVSGNPHNDGKYTPRKVRAAKDPNREPGFWDKEWKRSGLGESGLAKWSPVGDVGTFLKEKDAAYRAKHPATDKK